MHKLKFSTTLIISISFVMSLIGCTKSDTKKSERQTANNAGSQWINPQGTPIPSPTKNLCPEVITAQGVGNPNWRFAATGATWWSAMGQPVPAGLTVPGAQQVIQGTACQIYCGAEWVMPSKDEATQIPPNFLYYRETGGSIIPLPSANAYLTTDGSIDATPPEDTGSVSKQNQAGGTAYFYNLAQSRVFKTYKAVNAVVLCKRR